MYIGQQENHLDEFRISNYVRYTEDFALHPGSAESYEVDSGTSVFYLFDEYNETGLCLTQLRKLIDQYKKFDTSPGLYLDKAVKKERLAKKILTRYNTIKGKIKKRAEIR